VDGCRGTVVDPDGFIVDRSGTIAWIGNPIWPPGEFEDALGQVVGGSFGPRNAPGPGPAGWSGAKDREPGNEVEQADNDGRPRSGAQAAGRAHVAEHSGAGAYALRKFEILLNSGKDPAPAYQFARAAVDGPLKDDAESLNELAWTILEDDRLLLGNEGGARGAIWTWRSRPRLAPWNDRRA